MPIHNNEHGSFCVCYVVLPCSWPNLLSHFKISHGRKFEGELENALRGPPPTKEVEELRETAIRQLRRKRRQESEVATKGFEFP
jgi:hypothetical protein